jgi:hypothetical protein
MQWMLHARMNNHKYKYNKQQNAAKGGCNNQTIIPYLQICKGH